MGAKIVLYIILDVQRKNIVIHYIMGVTIFINFENNLTAFYPGQTIRGKVTLQNDSDAKTKGLTLIFFGETEVYWTESAARTDTVSPHRQPQQTSLRRHVQREYRNQETFLCHEILLHGHSAQGRKDEEFIISPGIREYPFAFQLPMALPSTFTESAFGFVKYTAEAKLSRSMFRYDRFEKEFFINGILDLNFIPNVFLPIGQDKRVEFGWPCCSDAYMTLDLKLEKSGFVPGEQIRFSGMVLNFSLETIERVWATFTQTVHFMTFDRVKTTTTDLLFTSYGSPVPYRDVIDWNDSFAVPSSLLPSGLAGCTIIHVNYQINLHAKPSGHDFKTVSAKVIIGTGPCSLHPSAIPPVLETQPSTSNTSMENSGIVFNPTTEHEIHQAQSSTKMEYNPSLNPFLESEPEENTDS
ncbi:Arrestin domain-containing protein 3 [Orchesella cincta]|uniref:Arrestin domain-containing protein 3 n=1 Tax=Orchesella cincta TaxID=48709 RepID=A0A1D2MAW8_ORCCI|nr:Arrestin domain-containing protein 3 [Orchesella cincta]